MEGMSASAKYTLLVGYRVKSFDIWALGITIVIGGQYFGWNAGLLSGFGSFALSTLITSIGYITLCCCTSELSSAAPFAGGAYGLARCTLGNRLGFVVGCCESLEYILYVATSAYSLGDMIAIIDPSAEQYAPLVWFAFYAVSLILHILGGSTFWRASYIMAVVSLLLLLVYCFGVLKWVNFNDHASQSNRWFEGGGLSFMQSFPLAAWFYVGVESLNMACSDVDSPKLMIPRGQISCVLTLFCTAVFVLFAASSFGNDLDSELLAFSAGYSTMFNISKRAAAILSLPAVFATAFGFIYSYGKLLVAMSDSRLLPALFNIRHHTTGKPYAALIFGSVFGYAVCLIVHFVPNASKHIFPICMMFAYVAYLSQCIGYIHLKVMFSRLPRQFHSPFGIPGAVLSMLVWTLGLICIIGFQNDDGVAVITFLVVVVVLLVYYQLVARKSQILSSDERSILYFAKERELLNVMHLLKISILKAYWKVSDVEWPVTESNAPISPKIVLVQPSTERDVASAPSAAPSATSASTSAPISVMAAAGDANGNVDLHGIKKSSQSAVEKDLMLESCKV